MHLSIFSVFSAFSAYSGPLNCNTTPGHRYTTAGHTYTTPGHQYHSRAHQNTTPGHTWTTTIVQVLCPFFKKCEIFKKMRSFSKNSTCYGAYCRTGWGYLSTPPSSPPSSTSHPAGVPLLQEDISLSYPFSDVLFTFPCDALLKGRLGYLFKTIQSPEVNKICGVVVEGWV